MSIMGFLFFNAVAAGRHAAAGTLTEFFRPFTDFPPSCCRFFFLGVLSSLITSLLSAYALKALPAVHVGLFNNVATIS